MFPGDPCFSIGSTIAHRRRLNRSDNEAGRPFSKALFRLPHRALPPEQVPNTQNHNRLIRLNNFLDLDVR